MTLRKLLLYVAKNPTVSLDDELRFEGYDEGNDGRPFSRPLNEIARREGVLALSEE